MTDSERDPYVEWIAQEARRPVDLGGDARARLLAAIRRTPAPARPRHPFGWLLAPRPVAMSPLVGAALAAGLVGIGVLFGVSTNRRDGRAPTEQPTAVAAKAQLPVHDTIHEVKFVVVAPQASHVALVGDFNNWNPSATPMTRTPTGGTWSVSVHLDPGRHVYAYVVDGKQWMADPSAPLAPEDGFGVPNSVVLVNRGAAL